MFRFHKTLDVITLFHSPNLPASTRVLNLLKTANANAAAATTQDQASNTPPTRRNQFELNVTEDPPTPDQLKSILDYVGADVGGQVAREKGGAALVKPGDLVRGARDRLDALRRLKAGGDGNGGFVRPVVVDWNNGKAVIGDNESEIMKLVSQIPEDTSPQ
ncbi:hypothetical protein FQN50_006895 [Emmonsiellopsis sp. PD_5]|nr:hypothetical protein FQN50_006895 [Emmonsiellopsis sp. PD_5]